ncbi:hypothetical protein BRADI_2g48363v3, partial [Brachypodium distachyon]
VALSLPCGPRIVSHRLPQQLPRFFRPRARPKRPRIPRDFSAHEAPLSHLSASPRNPYPSLSLFPQHPRPISHPSRRNRFLPPLRPDAVAARARRRRPPLNLVLATCPRVPGRSRRQRRKRLAEPPRFPSSPSRTKLRRRRAEAARAAAAAIFLISDCLDCEPCCCEECENNHNLGQGSSNEE